MNRSGILDREKVFFYLLSLRKQLEISIKQKEIQRDYPALIKFHAELKMVNKLYGNLKADAFDVDLTAAEISDLYNKYISKKLSS